MKNLYTSYQNILTIFKYEYLLKPLLILVFLFTFISNLIAQVQLGNSLYGEAAGDKCGTSICMPNANTIAIGAPERDLNGKNNVGNVRVFSWNGNSWILKGLSIDGVKTGEASGYSLSMPDSNTIAIGAPGRVLESNNSNNVRIFKWINNSWVQKGGDISNYGNVSFGISVHMPDSNTVAVGAVQMDCQGKFDCGVVRVFKWHINSWVQVGDIICGEETADGSGQSIFMPNSTTIAIGAPTNDGSGSNSGHVRVYHWNGNLWVQKGGDINGNAAGEFFGMTVYMVDTSTLAIGAPMSGKVRIYTWDNGISWVQKGADINGYGQGSSNLSMPDSNTIAVGEPSNGQNGQNSGQSRIYKWNGIAWIEIFNRINGDAPGDQFGYSITMPDSFTVAIGARFNNGNGQTSGQVRVYSLNNTTSLNDIISQNKLKVYPNPAKSEITINDLDFNSIKNRSVKIYNTLGQILFQTEIDKEQLKIDITNWGGNGLYFIHIINSQGTILDVKKLIIE